MIEVKPALYDRVRGIFELFLSTLSVDELDSTLLAEQPPLSTEEVEVNSTTTKSSFLSFYSPSGRVYYLTPEDSMAKYGKHFIKSIALLSHACAVF